jgi:acyl carrier protein
MDKSEISSWLSKKISETTKTPLEKINIHSYFSDYGLDSVTAVTVTAELENWLGLQLVPNIFWEYPTVDQLADHLAGELVN